MRQVFEEREIDETGRGHETEITLGATGLLAICFGLILICGLFFGLGYAAGHRAPVAMVGGPQTASNAGSLAMAAGNQPKPSAAPQPAIAQPASADASAQTPPSADPDGDVIANPASATAGQAVAPQAANPSAPNQWTVKPAMPTQPTQPSTAPVTAAPVAPALRLMVQIAAVSHAEDASVLTNALLRRGYAVTARRDPTDNLIHVQVGPFNNVNDANAMRLKLLNDGYNAIVEP
ncbi:MAG: SPOR domain-containing protein [Terracidiphilus sp.]